MLLQNDYNVLQHKMCKILFKHRNRLNASFKYTNKRVLQRFIVNISGGHDE